ncbi:MAG: hypothetical protein AB7L41_15150, partial [Flavobacteriaceae bacterium]
DRSLAVLQRALPDGGGGAFHVIGSLDQWDWGSVGLATTHDIGRGAGGGKPGNAAAALTVRRNLSRDRRKTKYSEGLGASKGPHLSALIDYIPSMP